MQEHEIALNIYEVRAFEFKRLPIEDDARKTNGDLTNFKVFTQKNKTAA